MKKRRSILCVFGLLMGILCLGTACAKEDREIVLGYDNTAEEAIIANMLVDLIEDKTDIKVQVIGDLAGGNTVLHPAILEGEIDMYPEYTGTAWLTILKRTDIPPTQELNTALFEAYEKDFGLEWVGLYGFSNAYGLAVSEELQMQYSLKTYSDLREIAPKLRFAAEPGFFEREDGYTGLCSAYGFSFKESFDVAFSVKYDTLKEGKVDVINIFTTDGRLAGSNAAVLEDDLGYFPEYRCGSVVRKETLKKYPELKAVLLMMEGIISDSDMVNLNSMVEVDGMDPETVAENFLQERGLIEK